jgi:GNAT superfamily N-acetyltransferase
MECSIRNYTPKDEDRVVEIQQRYKETHQSYWIREGKLYSEHPAFEQGKNIFIAFNGQDAPAAFSPIFPALADEGEGEPHHLWIDILYNPFDPNYLKINDALFERVQKRGLALKKTYNGHPCVFATLQMGDDLEAMNFFHSKGFEETTRLLTMRRDLKNKLPQIPDKEGFVVRGYQLDGKEIIEKYLQADRMANPSSPLTREKLEWNLENPWKNGEGYGIFTKEGDLLASTMTYSIEKDITMTEEIFVIPSYQGKGLGKLLLAEVLQRLKDKGAVTVELEVKSDNKPATSLYQKLGYITVKEECTLKLEL